MTGYAPANSDFTVATIQTAPQAMVDKRDAEAQADLDAECVHRYSHSVELFEWDVIVGFKYRYPIMN